MEKEENAFITVLKFCGLLVASLFLPLIFLVVGLYDRLIEISVSRKKKVNNHGEEYYSGRGV